jgi:hypothetical protein
MPEVIVVNILAGDEPPEYEDREEDDREYAIWRDKQDEKRTE